MACENFEQKIVDYLSDDDIAQFFCMINPNFTSDQIPDYIRQSSAEWLAFKTNTAWVECNQTFLLSGDGTACVELPRVPIVELTSITIIKHDDTTFDLTLTGTEKQIQYACDTGVIKLIKPIHLDDSGSLISTDCVDTELFNTSVQSSLRFPTGVNNIKIVGVFGSKPLALLKLLQLLNMGKTMQLLQPEQYAFGKVSEQIGRYRYSLGVSTGDNKVLSYDGYIETLCKLLPMEESFTILAV